MQVVKITSPVEASSIARHQITEKQFYDEINFHRAEKVASRMLESGLISTDEYSRIMAESRKIFVPLLAEIL